MPHESFIRDRKQQGKILTHAHKTQTKFSNFIWENWKNKNDVGKEEVGKKSSVHRVVLYIVGCVCFAFSARWCYVSQLTIFIFALALGYFVNWMETSIVYFFQLFWVFFFLLCVDRIQVDHIFFLWYWIPNRNFIFRKLFMLCNCVIRISRKCNHIICCFCVEFVFEYFFFLFGNFSGALHEVYYFSSMWK